MIAALPRPRAADVALATALLALGQLTTWLRIDSTDAFAGPRWLNALVLALGALPVLWLRLAPATALIASAAFLCLPHLVAELDVTVLGQFVTLIVVTASCGYHASSRGAVLGAAVAVAGMTVVSLVTPFLRTPTALLFNLVVLLAPWAAARALRHREERARRLGAALEHQRTQLEARVQEAVERERAAIARDLHDIVAHGVSVMVLQVGGARMQWAEDPGRAAGSLLQAEESGRQALSELRRMLGVLRAAPVSEVEPRPSLRHLDTLVRRASSAGLQVSTEIVGALHELPPAVDISAYRIVQEAITNVIRHSDADRAVLVIDSLGAQLSILVRDAGRRSDGVARDGYGLIGIRERVSFLGGRVRIGPGATEGWEVAVAIPMGTDAPRTDDGTVTLP